MGDLTRYVAVIVGVIVSGAITFAPRRTLRLIFGPRAAEFPGRYFGMVHLIAIPVFLFLTLQFLSTCN